LVEVLKELLFKNFAERVRIFSPTSVLVVVCKYFTRIVPSGRCRLKDQIDVQKMEKRRN
jgi:hypothetical protein